MQVIEKATALPDRDKEMFPLYYVYLLKTSKPIQIMAPVILVCSIGVYVETGLDSVYKSLLAFPHSDWMFFTALPLLGFFLLFVVFPCKMYYLFRKSLVELYYKSGPLITFTSEGASSGSTMLLWSRLKPIHGNKLGFVLKLKKGNTILLFLRSSFTEEEYETLCSWVYCGR